jgi:hypothetical protein
MTERDRSAGRPLEESPEVAAAVDDDTTVPQLVTDGGAGRDTPTFAEPRERPADAGQTEDVLGAPYGGGTGGAGPTARTGGEQPWDPEDLVAARGQDLTPENIERARRDLAEMGRAAVERTVP